MHEAWADDLLLTFDGAVLEVFGFPGSDSLRYHVRNLDLTVEEGKEGRRHVTVKPASRGGGCAFDVPAADWPAAGALIDAVLAAMPEE